MITRTRRFMRSPNNGGYLGRPRDYKCVVCGESFQRDAVNSVPYAERVCSGCKKKHTLIPLAGKVITYALDGGTIYHLRNDCPLLAGGFARYDHLKAGEVRTRNLIPCVICAYTDFDPRQPYWHQPNPSGLTDVDWDVILHQGTYFREDAGASMSDAKYREWLDEQKEE